jgi:hypothetical protein
VWGAVAVGLGVAAVVAHLTVPGRLWLSALAGAAALAVGLPPAVLDHCTRATERWAQRVLVALRVGLTAGVRTAASAAGRAVDVLGGHLAPRGPDGGPRRAATLRRSDVPWAVLVAAVSCGAVTYQVVWAWRAGVQPIGHSATVAARAWDVGTSNHPWLGMPTTFSDPIRGTEASHPGPLLFDLLAPFVRVFGLRAGAFIGCAVINLACWLVGTWAALRAGGRSAALLAWVAGGIVLHVLLRGAVYEAANALPTWLAILTCLLLCWAAVSGTPTALVGAVLLASLTSQAYLAHALVTVLPTAWAFGVVLRDRLRRHRPASDARALLGAVAVAVLCWAQPAAEALSNGGGNVVALWYGVSSDRPSLGWSGLWRAVAWTLGVPPPFGRLDRVFAPDWRHYLGGLAPWGLVVAAAVAVAWGARRQRALTAERRLWVLAVLTVAAAGVSLVALPVAMTAFYQLVWLGVVSVFAWFAIAESARRAVLDRWKVGAALAPRLRVAGVVVVAAAVTWFSTSAPDGVLDLKGPYGVTDLATPALVDAALTATADGDPTLVLGMDRLTEQSAADVVTANLIAEGRDVLVEPYVGTYYGPDRVVEEGWSGRSLLLVDGAAPRNPDGRRLARFEPPGWSPERFRRTAEQVRTWAVEHGPLTVDPTLVPRLLPYADGWMADLDCGRARRLEQGAIDASQLPAGVVVALYADAAVSTPRLPGRLRRAVERDAIATPVELWAAELDVPPGRSLQSADLLRSGRLCDRPDPDRAGR